MEIHDCVNSSSYLFQDFTHPVIDNREFSDPIWDTRNFLKIERLLPSIENAELRRILKTVITDFKSSVLPRIASMSHGILHYDACSRNIIVQTTNGDMCHVAGIIDFTDSTHCPHVFELAILVADLLSVWDCDPVVNVGSVIAGYCHSFPLSRDELECLYTIVLARLCTIIVATSLNYESDEKSSVCGTEYHSKIVAESRKAMNELTKFSKEKVNEIWLGALKQPVI